MQVLSIFGIVNVSDLPPHIAESIVGYLRKFLNCNRDAFLVFGAEVRRRCCASVVRSLMVEHVCD